MRWQGGEQSCNLEDRRRIGGRGMAIGGGGLLLLVVLGLIAGVDPQQLNQLIGQAQGPGVAGQQRELTPEQEQ